MSEYIYMNEQSGNQQRDLLFTVTLWEVVLLQVLLLSFINISSQGQMF